MKKRIVSLLLALVMVLSLVPTTVWAAENHDGQVRVIVENTTYAKADGAAWDGTLVDKWVDLVPGSSMMDCIVSALGSYSQTGADSGYITEINGLTAGDGGAASGWMGTLNDWFTNVGFKDIKAGDKLFAGDVIRVMYTVNGYGADIGGDWNTQSDTSLAALSFSEGVLTPDFASDKTAYTLTLPQGVTGIRMTATASNKNNQVYLSADGTDYRRVETVPVHNGTVLTIRCGDAAAATEWSPAITPTTYTVTVSQEGDAPQGDMDVSFKGLHNAQLSDIKVYSYTDGVKGDKNLLEGVDIEPNGYGLMYNTKLPVGDYLVEGYNTEGQCNGTLVLTVKANQENVFTLVRAYAIYATNDSSSWVEGQGLHHRRHRYRPRRHGPPGQDRRLHHLWQHPHRLPVCGGRQPEDHPDPHRRQGGGLSACHHHHDQQADRGLRRQELLSDHSQGPGHHRHRPRRLYPADGHLRQLL